MKAFQYKLGSPAAMRQEPNDFYLFEEREARRDEAIDRAEAKQREQEECSHHDVEHFQCLECGKEFDPGAEIDRVMDMLEDR